MFHLHDPIVWLLIGFVGQAMFFLRFFVQWLASERAGRSVVPKTFWYFSILGGISLFAYAIWRQDPVFIIGQSTGLFIYLRNLTLLARERQRASRESDAAKLRADEIYSV